MHAVIIVTGVLGEGYVFRFGKYVTCNYRLLEIPCERVTCVPESVAASNTMALTVKRLALIPKPTSKEIATVVSDNRAAVL
jgi:hypothetical protein